jgi:hypothetical protein
VCGLLILGALILLYFCHIIIMPAWLHRARRSFVNLITCGCCRPRRRGGNGVARAKQQ